MTTAKNEILNWLLLKNCYSLGAINHWWWWCMCGGWFTGRNFGYWGGLPSITQVGKTLSSGFILKIILPRVVGFKCIAWGFTSYESFITPKKFQLYRDDVFDAWNLALWIFSSICLIKVQKVSIFMKYGEFVPLGKPVLFFWRASSFILLIFLFLLAMILI